MKIADFLWPRSTAAEGLGSIALFDTRPRSAESLAARLRQHYPVLRVAIRDNDPAGLDLAARKSQKGRLGTRAASAAHARVWPRPQRELNSADPAALNSRAPDQADISFPRPERVTQRSDRPLESRFPAEEKDSSSRSLLRPDRFSCDMRMPWEAKRTVD
jgi:hypothetical protein